MHKEEKSGEVILQNNRIEKNDIGINIDPNYFSNVIIIENNQLINNKEDRAYTG
jgi:hypothetical protein